jgi:crossover junction endodeoxyribonuclease RuvC
MRILGVDPGSLFTGYGCIDLVGHHISLVTHGVLKLSLKGKAKGQSNRSFSDRLLAIYNGLSNIILVNRPEILVVEKVFFSKNAVSALKLGQARGATLLTGAMHGLSIREYNPTAVKASIVGYGRADKTQVAKMVEVVVGPQRFSSLDASDALALALHHAFFLLSNRKELQQAPEKRKTKRSLAAAVEHRIKEGEN